jgi:hypothetical protein
MNVNCKNAIYLLNCFSAFFSFCSLPGILCEESTSFNSVKRQVLTLSQI